MEANAIRVSVRNGNKVILDGKVDDWDERALSGTPPGPHPASPLSRII